MAARIVSKFHPKRWVIAGARPWWMNHRVPEVDYERDPGLHKWFIPRDSAGACQCTTVASIAAWLPGRGTSMVAAVASVVSAVGGLFVRPLSLPTPVGVAL
jgi:hypothetical protein